MTMGVIIIAIFGLKSKTFIQHYQYCIVVHWNIQTNEYVQCWFVVRKQKTTVFFACTENKISDATRQNKTFGTSRRKF